MRRKNERFTDDAGRVVTDAARYDGHELKAVLDKTNTGSDPWADTAYGSKDNRKMLAKEGLRADIHTRKPQGRAMIERARQANVR